MPINLFQLTPRWTAYGGQMTEYRQSGRRRRTHIAWGVSEVGRRLKQGASYEEIREFLADEGLDLEPIFARFWNEDPSD